MALMDKSPGSAFDEVFEWQLVISVFLECTVLFFHLVLDQETADQDY
jgi:hypothetical protein